MRWWVVGMLREGLTHLGLALVLWLALYWLLASPDGASLGTALFFVGREVRDFEIEALPGLAHALGFTGWKGLPPAMTWDLTQLRHSLSGWLPVCLVCGLVAWLF